MNDVPSVLPAAGLRLGVVSDTHGQVVHTRAAVRMLESLGVQQVLHCGDIGSPDVVDLFQPWPTHFVFGNVDDAWEEELRAAIGACGQTCHGGFGALEIAGRRVALLHSHDAALFRETICSGRFDLVCYGHTHVARLERLGETLVLNPGAVYRARPHSLAIVDLPELRIETIPLD